ncbi:MAG: hypothetical protein ABI658_11995 [Acidimicrobiales bacterium]
MPDAPELPPEYVEALRTVFEANVVVAAIAAGSRGRAIWAKPLPSWRTTQFRFGTDLADDLWTAEHRNYQTPKIED